jgi:ribonuclease I
MPVNDWKGLSRALYILRSVAFRSHPGKVVLAVVALAVLSACDARQDKSDTPAAVKQKPVQRQPADQSVGPSFDFYLLALTVHASFCAEHSRYDECRTPAPRPLVIHGLWPENRAPNTYPHDCAAPPLQLDRGLELELQDFMPGMQAGLHEHEWREHGACSGLDADTYFRRTLELARDLDGALSERLTTLALSGGEATPAQLREAAEMFRPGSGATFTLHCRTLRGAPRALRDRPFLVEIRQCVDNDGPGGAPGTLLDCAKLDRHDQGCGSFFQIARMSP